MNEPMVEGAAPAAAHPEPRLPASPEGPSPIEQAIFFVNGWRKVLNARLLAFFALLGALVFWGYTVYDPNALRLWASSLYSLGVLWPVMALFLRKG